MENFSDSPNSIDPSIFRKRKFQARSFALLIIILEVGLLFAPFGAFFETYTYIINSRETIAKGLNPCVVCGKPAQKIKYKSISSLRGSKTKYVYKYCSKHAPSSLGLDESALRVFGWIFLILTMILTIYHATALWSKRGEKIYSNLMSDNPSKYKIAIFSPLVPFILYLFVSIVFFWLNAFFYC